MSSHHSSHRLSRAYSHGYAHGYDDGYYDRYSTISHDRHESSCRSQYLDDLKMCVAYNDCRSISYSAAGTRSASRRGGGQSYGHSTRIVYPGCESPPLGPGGFSRRPESERAQGYQPNVLRYSGGRSSTESSSGVSYASDSTVRRISDRSQASDHGSRRSHHDRDSVSWNSSDTLISQGSHSSLYGSDSRYDGSSDSYGSRRERPPFFSDSFNRGDRLRSAPERSFGLPPIREERDCVARDRGKFDETFVTVRFNCAGLTKQRRLRPATDHN